MQKYCSELIAINLQLPNQTPVENNNLMAVSDLITLLEILSKLLDSFELELNKDSDYTVIINKKNY